jgi:hypothetical protein
MSRVPCGIGVEERGRNRAFLHGKRRGHLSFFAFEPGKNITISTVHPSVLCGKIKSEK